MTTETPKNPRKIPTKPKDEAVITALTEIRGAIPTFAICNALVIVICVFYSIVYSSEGGVALLFENWQLLTGLLFGNAAMLANFYYLGVKTANIVRLKDARRARVYATTGFFLRYFGAFAVFGVMIHFGIVNVITALMPLFYPKIHYTYKALRSKEV
jgi:pheromone shutdown protein TraB